MEVRRGRRVVCGRRGDGVEHGSALTATALLRALSDWPGGGRDRPGRPGSRPYNAYSLRAGFVTYAHLRGASDQTSAYPTRHRSIGTVGTDIRIHEAWTDIAATMLGL